MAVAAGGTAVLEDDRASACATSRAARSRRECRPNRRCLCSIRARWWRSHASPGRANEVVGSTDSCSN